jgi:hypothetical protein
LGESTNRGESDAGLQATAAQVLLDGVDNLPCTPAHRKIMFCFDVNIVL